MKKIAAFLLTLLWLAVLGCNGAEKKNPELPVSTDEIDRQERRVEDRENIPYAETEAETTPAERAVDAMSLEEKVGQLFFVQCPESAETAIERYHFGGILLFSWNIENMTGDELLSFTAAMQASSTTPLFIGTDEEGGTVTRISANPGIRSEKFISPREAFESGGWAEIESGAVEMAQLLKSVGININFAPVCDISVNSDDFMYKRSIGLSPSDTAEFVELTVRTFKNFNLGSVLKHFPGYGNNGDTHTGRVYDERGLSEFYENDFIPFQAGISAGATMVMVSHNTVLSIDEKTPASLSPEVNRILRDELGYDGVIITDDLTMSAVKDITDSASAAVLATLAGNDMICCADYENQIPAVIAAVENGTISEEQIDDSVRRILEAKTELGIISGEVNDENS